MSSPSHSPMAERDRLFCTTGDIIGEYFRVIEMSGEGTFSNVYSCIDTRTQDNIIIKACRSKRCYYEAAQEEVKTMHKLNIIDVSHHFFVRYYGYFTYKGHICIIFERLGSSLFSILQYHHFRPFRIDAIRSFMWQIVSAVDVLHRNNMVHTDLKLENILLKEKGLIDRDGFDLDSGMSATSVRLIDFGSSDTGSAWHHHLVTTRHYRAPEILMGLRWGYECDIWSLGCILVELAVGRIDFDARDVVEHLYLIQQMIGPIPRKMWSSCSREELRPFSRDGIIKSEYLPKNRETEDLRKPLLSHILSFDHQLADLALKMLNPDQYERPKASTLMCHKFFGKYRESMA
ncbi:Serine/threonine-protein kinase AFC1 [Tritrichomonas foetus]|uniref:Serine/threonine-protein kinase AFC1 n=1 Tax=Tritrichomonas foetus TaxID=1144522 RepID=A0A1J4JJ83_9EUKA|nr:Serine/threonine-protein kinase AFC1 [Tritrichomonas foetus]|eukprot:OHS97619.1 Serine/threonine-protein kinase AFC1 [Tritrichomonas foetus]